jgi:hypothetical protein
MQDISFLIFSCSFAGCIFFTRMVSQSILGFIFTVITILDELVITSEHQAEGIRRATVTYLIYLRDNISLVL